MLTLGKPKKFFVCFNGLYTPFGSPVIGGQKRLIAFLSLSLIPLRGLLDRGRLGTDGAANAKQTCLLC